jgi:hypothetical protein
MKAARATLLGCVLVGACFTAALGKTIKLNTESQQTSKWTVDEITDGQIVSAPAQFDNTGYGKLPGYVTIPFTNCDGYWRARRLFHIPVGATNLVFKITALGVDDRAVIKLNGVKITGVGTTAKGRGNMQFHDPGKNRSHYFQFKSGPVSLIDTTDLKIGRNDLKIIVNNTNNGIHGTIVPINQGSPSSFGIEASVTYTP